MSIVNNEVTRKVAKLARLNLSDAEVELYTRQIQKTLDYVGQLQSVSTEGVEPMTHPFDQELLKREDRSRIPLKDAQDQPRVLEHAPEVLYGGYKVPPVI